jgi:alpha-tubulin suppressor-like RCC1 family protein
MIPPDAAVQLAAGGRHACAVLQSGALHCWGFNSNGQLGIESLQESIGRANSQIKAAKLPPGEKVQKLALGTAHTCVSTVTPTGVNHIRCFGDNRIVGKVVDVGIVTGQTPGSVATADVTLGDGEKLEKVNSIASGVRHVCADIVVNNMRQTRCWGNNEWGQLGLERVAPSYEVVPQRIAGAALPGPFALGEDASCALSDDVSAELKCWGRSNEGQGGPVAGIGTDGFTKAMSNINKNSLGMTINPSLIAAGQYFTCASDGIKVRCFGKGDNGRTGRGDQTTVGLMTNDFPNNLRDVALNGEGVRHLSTGLSHACVVTMAGQVRCWGDGTDGKLGTGNTSDVLEGANEDASRVSFGARKATQVACGNEFTCALLDNGAVVCWGKNDRGQLGRKEDASDVKDPGKDGSKLKEVDLDF